MSSSHRMVSPAIWWTCLGGGGQSVAGEMADDECFLFEGLRGEGEQLLTVVRDDGDAADEALLLERRGRLARGLPELDRRVDDRVLQSGDRTARQGGTIGGGLVKFVDMVTADARVVHVLDHQLDGSEEFEPLTRRVENRGLCVELALHLLHLSEGGRLFCLATCTSLGAPLRLLPSLFFQGSEPHGARIARRLGTVFISHPHALALIGQDTERILGHRTGMDPAGDGEVVGKGGNDHEAKCCDEDRGAVAKVVGICGSVLRRLEVSGSCGEVNDVHAARLCCEGPPSIDLAHRDLP
ncbi:protein of unknown function (plasmid) [Rhodovastum atsumiense]|nr:protein of unknown function [Rhodovastum atsumiense]